MDRYDENKLTEHAGLKKVRRHRNPNDEPSKNATSSLPQDEPAKPTAKDEETPKEETRDKVIRKKHRTLPENELQNRELLKSDIKKGEQENKRSIEEEGALDWLWGSPKPKKRRRVHRESKNEKALKAVPSDVSQATPETKTAKELEQETKSILKKEISRNQAETQGNESLSEDANNQRPNPAFPPGEREALKDTKEAYEPLESDFNYKRRYPSITSVSVSEKSIRRDKSDPRSLLHLSQVYAMVALWYSMLALSLSLSNLSELEKETRKIFFITMWILGGVSLCVGIRSFQLFTVYSIRMFTMHLS